MYPTTRKSKCSVNAAAFDSLTPEAVYWLGFLFADGHISRRTSSGAGTLEVCLSVADIDHLHKLRSFLQSTHKIYRGTRNNTHLKVSSRQFTERLTELGLDRKSLQRVPPPSVIGCRDFWRGVVDGDGHISLRRNTAAIGLIGSIAVVNGFALWARTICSRIDAQVLCSTMSASLYSFGTEGQTAVELVRALYEGAPEALTRKMQIAVTAMALPMTSVRHKFTLEDDTLIHSAVASKKRGAFAQVGRAIGLSTPSVYQRAKHLGLLPVTSVAI